MLLENSIWTTALPFFMIPSALSTSFIANGFMGSLTTSTFTIPSHGFSSFMMASMCSFHTLFRPSSANTIFPFSSLMQLLPAKSFASYDISVIPYLLHLFHRLILHCLSNSSLGFLFVRDIARFIFSRWKLLPPLKTFPLL